MEDADRHESAEGLRPLPHWVNEHSERGGILFLDELCRDQRGADDAGNARGAGED